VRGEGGCKANRFCQNGGKFFRFVTVRVWVHLREQLNIARIDSKEKLSASYFDQSKGCLGLKRTYLDDTDIGAATFSQNKPFLGKGVEGKDETDNDA